jgi:Zn-dependent peptidase ImmA (M78 family)
LGGFAQEKIFALQSLDWESVSFTFFSKYMTAETFLKCARSAQSTLTKHAGESLTPPINIERIAEALGFHVVRIHSALDEFSGLVSPKHKLIGVNGNHHLHRQRFTVAHEVGHIILRHPPESLCTTREIAEYDTEADVCASELLIPVQLIAPHLIALRATAKSTLSKLFDVSEEAMTMKIQHLEQFRVAMK